MPDEGWEGAGTPFNRPEGTKKKSGNSDWYSECQINSRGNVLANHANVMLALRQDSAWHDVFGYDLMREQVMILREFPSHGQNRNPRLNTPRPRTDTDDARALEWMQIAGIPSVSLHTVATAISQRAQELAFHPVRDWIRDLEWDGVPRIQGGVSALGDIIDPWLVRYFSADASVYTSAVGTMWLVSAVARIMKPGCKVDHTIILEGKQGSGKSTACRILAGDAYFSDSLPPIDSKDAMDHLRGIWIVEIAELDALTRAEATAIKAFLTQQVGKFRPAYGRHEIEHKRQCVFVGTTNQDAYLKDETGGRRFWPVKTRWIDLEALRLDRDQLWAEARHLYETGVAWHIMDPDVLRATQDEQALRYDSDVWMEPVTDYLRGKSQVTIGEIMKGPLAYPTAQMSRAAQNRVRIILKSLGWRRGKRSRFGQQWLKSEETND